jgi:AcrR family transcriptional regulator
MQSRTKDAPRKFRRRADARPDEILDAALSLFNSRGFAATRMEDVATRAGITKATIYLYFPSKEAVFEGLVRRAISPNIRQAQAMMSQFRGRASEGLSMLLGFLEKVLADPDILAVPILVLREASAFPSIAAMYRREVIDQMRPVLGGLYRLGVENGEFRPADPELVLRSLIGPIFANALMTRVFGLGPDGPGANAEFFAHHRDYLAHGLLTDPKGKL